MPKYAVWRQALWHSDNLGEFRNLKVTLIKILYQVTRRLHLQKQTNVSGFRDFLSPANIGSLRQLCEKNKTASCTEPLKDKTSKPVKFD